MTDTMTNGQAPAPEREARTVSEVRGSVPMLLDLTAYDMRMVGAGQQTNDQTGEIKTDRDGNAKWDISVLLTIAGTMISDQIRISVTVAPGSKSPVDLAEMFDPITFDRVTVNHWGTARGDQASSGLWFTGEGFRKAGSPAPTTKPAAPKAKTDAPTDDGKSA